MKAFYTLLILMIPFVGFGQFYGVALSGDGTSNYPTYMSYSEDGGISWTISEGGNIDIPYFTYNSLMNKNIVAFSLINDTIKAIGLDEICTSYDGGISYDCQNYNMNYSLSSFGGGSFSGTIDAPSDDMNFINSNIGYLFEEKNYQAAILKTTDGGINWDFTTQYSWSNAYEKFTDASFVNDSVFYLIDNFNKVFKTTNSGESINLINDLTTFTENGPNQNNGIFFTSELNGYVLLKNNQILHSEDGGVNWSFLSEVFAVGCGFPESPCQQRELYFYDDNNGYFFNQMEADGLLYKLNISDELVWEIYSQCPFQQYKFLKEYSFYEVQDISSIDENYNELNIYPNPSSNIFNLEFNADSGTEILVTNILGEQVYFESTKSIGEFNTQIDLSNYSKGIYNLTIKTSDGISNHKLILQ